MLATNSILVLSCAISNKEYPFILCNPESFMELVSLGSQRLLAFQFAWQFSLSWVQGVVELYTDATDGQWNHFNAYAKNVAC